MDLISAASFCLFVVLLLQWLLVLLLLLVLQLLQCSWFYSNYCFSYIYYFYDCNSYWFYYYYSTTALLFPTPPLTSVTLIDLSWLSTNAIFCKSIKCRLKTAGDILYQSHLKFYHFPTLPRKQFFPKPCNSIVPPNHHQFQDGRSPLSNNSQSNCLHFSPMVPRRASPQLWGCAGTRGPVIDHL